MPSFLSNLADKAQSALNASPIGAHIPHLTSTTDPAAAPAQANHPPAQTQPQAAGRSHGLENISHQLRVFQQQYGSTTTPIQKLITAEKSVVIDHASLARDIKIQSKELFTFGQSEADDLKDVTDRAAYLNFVHGSLTDNLAVTLDGSRTGLKSIRDAEAALLPKRNVRASVQQQITKINNDGLKGATVDKRLAELQDTLKRADAEDHDMERQLEITKRKFLRESEAAKWTALREYAEKLLLLSQAAGAVLEVLPSIPPTQATPYAGASKTASVRDALQHALDSWTPGTIKLPPLPERANSLETRSFGETHATELSNINSHPSLHAHTSALPNVSTSSATDASAKPINPFTLNQSPVTLPSPPPSTLSNTAPALASVTPDVPSPTPVLPAATPTVAETGVPIAAGGGGPGPRTGSLAGGAAVFGHPSAEDEKKRLEREERERVLRLATSPPGYDPVPGTSTAPPAGAPPAHESAEEEKKRLEREERERVLAAGGTNKPGSGNPGGDIPPPY